MNDLIKVSHLGLRQDEIKVLKSVFSFDPKLKVSFKLLDASQSKHADVILINYDDPIALEIWDKIAKYNRVTQKVLLGTSIPPDESGFTLNKPIRPRNLLRIFERIIAEEHTNISFGDTDSNPVDSRRQAVYLSDANSFRILVVDGSYSSRRKLEKKLGKLVKTMILSISFASSSEEVLLKTQAKQYDLILLDIDIPGLDSSQMCSEIRATQQVHLTLMTSSKSPLDMFRISRFGADTCLLKSDLDWRLEAEIENALKEKIDRLPGQKVNG